VDAGRSVTVKSNSHDCVPDCILPARGHHNMECERLQRTSDLPSTKNAGFSARNQAGLGVAATKCVPCVQNRELGRGSKGGPWLPCP